MSEDGATRAGKGVEGAGAAGDEAWAEGAPEQDPALQFEKAEFDEGPPALACGACQQSIDALYYQVGGAVMCGACRDRVVHALESGKGRAPFLRAAGYGVAAAAVGSLIWYAIREVTGYEIGLVAIGVGILVGVAVKNGSGGLGGARYQALAMVLTYLSITMTNLPIIVSELSKQADVGGVVMGAIMFGIALASPFLAGFENIIGIIIIGIGLYEAWKINRFTPPEIAGPFAVQGARGGARDRAVDRAA